MNNVCAALQAMLIVMFFAVCDFKGLCKGRPEMNKKTVSDCGIM